MFNQILEELNSSIVSHGGHKVNVEKRFQEYFSKKKDTVIRSFLWDVPGFRRWRVTRMDGGEKLQVLNSVAYPNYSNEQPILGIDLLWFEKKGKLVAVLDFQPLIQNDHYFRRYFEGLKTLKKNYPDFYSNKEMNLYDSKKYFSPWVLFYVGEGNNLKYSLREVFIDFLDQYWLVHKEPVQNYQKLSPKKIKELHIEYDSYNAEVDPAHGLFKSYFGKEWADDFVQEFLFPNCNKRI